MEKLVDIYNIVKNFVIWNWDIAVNYFTNLDPTERLIITILAGVLLFYIFYRIFGILPALAFMFFIFIGYLVYMSELEETMNKFEESKRNRLQQVEEEILKD